MTTVRAPTVILISLDGVRHDYLSREQLATGRFPNFARVAREGSRALSLTPAFPPATFPGHVTLATGAPAEVHGIVANQFPDAQLGFFEYSDDARFLEVEPIWSAAERQGVRTAVFFWPGSETDWRGHGPSYRRAPFDSAVLESKKVAQLAAWLALPAPARPRLLLSWWRGTDGTGHRHGPADARNVERLAQQDAQLGRLLRVLDARALWSHTTLLLVSDHGMAGVSRVHDVRETLAREKIAARIFQAGGFANVHVYERAETKRAARALSKLAGVRAFTRAELPRALRYNHARAGDVVALAAPGTALLRHGSALALRRRANKLLGNCEQTPPTETHAAGDDGEVGNRTRAVGDGDQPRDAGDGGGADNKPHAVGEFNSLAAVARNSCIGVHGHDPSEARAVHGIFFALGRGVPHAKTLGEVCALDVAATASALLGINAPQHSEGRALFAP